MSPGTSCLCGLKDADVIYMWPERHHEIHLVSYITVLSLPVEATRTREQASLCLIAMLLRFGKFRPLGLQTRGKRVILITLIMPFMSPLLIMKCEFCMRATMHTLCKGYNIDDGCKNALHLDRAFISLCRLLFSKFDGHNHHAAIRVLLSPGG